MLHRLIKNGFIPSTICSAEGEGEGGAGGGGGGEGEGEGEGLDENIAKAIDEKVNKAVSTHLTRFRTSFEKDLNKSFGELLAPIGTQLQELAARPVPEPPKPGEGEGGGAGGESAEMKALATQRKKDEARIVELENKYRDEAIAREGERAQRLQDEERNALATVLNDAGITGTRARAAMALLYNEDKRIKRDDDGNIMFTIPKAGYVDEVTLTDGIEEWLKTDDGKTFLPPKGAGGSGGKGSKRPGQRGEQTKGEKVQEAKVQLAEMMGVLPPGTSEGMG